MCIVSKRWSVQSVYSLCFPFSLLFLFFVPNVVLFLWSLVFHGRSAVCHLHGHGCPVWQQRGGLSCQIWKRVHQGQVLPWNGELPWTRWLEPSHCCGVCLGGGELLFGFWFLDLLFAYWSRTCIEVTYASQLISMSIGVIQLVSSKWLGDRVASVIFPPNILLIRRLFVTIMVHRNNGATLSLCVQVQRGWVLTCVGMLNFSMSLVECH